MMKFRSFALLATFSGLILIASMPVFSQAPGVSATPPPPPSLTGEVAPSGTEVASLPAAPPKAAAPFTGNNFEDLPWRGSVMFGESELKTIYGSMGGSAFVDSSAPISIPTDVSDIAAVPEQQAVVAPAFYLNSILFYNRNNWTVWINSRRIRLNTQLNGLEIGRVTPKYVELLWKPSSLDLISPGWASNMKSVGASYPASQKIKPVAETPVPAVQPKQDGQKNLEQVANNINDVFSSLEKNESPVPGSKESAEAPILETPIPDLEEVKMAALTPENFVMSFMLPRLYAQEEFLLDLSKIEALLQEEEGQILAMKQAEETIVQAKKTSQYFNYSGKEDEFYAYADKALPYLWEYSSNDENVLVDTINGVVLFRLGVGQTFVSKEMKIAEGYVASTILEGTVQPTGEVATGDLEKVLFEQQSQNGTQDGQSTGDATTSNPPGKSFGAQQEGAAETDIALPFEDE